MWTRDKSPDACARSAGSYSKVEAYTVDQESARESLNRKWVAPDLKVVTSEPLRSEVTARALLVGVLLGVVVLGVNLVTGLKTGSLVSGSVLGAILGFVLVRSLSAAFPGSRPLSMLENNIIQTTSSAAGTVSVVVVSVVAALLITGYELTAWKISLYVFGVSLMGVFFAVPFRRYFVCEEKLPFPAGTATARTIEALHAAEKGARSKAKALTLTGLLAMAFTWFRDARPAFIPANIWMPDLGSFSFKRLYMGLHLSPMMFGIGLLVGPRVGLSLLLGTVGGWGILAPAMVRHGAIESYSFRTVAHWMLWPAASIMVAYGLAATLLRWKSLAKTIRSLGSASWGRDSETDISRTLWLVGTVIAASISVVTLRVVFGIPIWMGMLAIALSAPLALISVRALGETGVSAVGSLGHVTQLIFGAAAPAQPATNLMTAGLTTAGATEASDLMEDLKAGYLLEATPKNQTLAQIVGILAGAAAAGPLFFLLLKGYGGIANEALPSPAAVSWSGLTTVLAEGFSALPAGCLVAVVVAAFAGIVLAVLEVLGLKSRLPSAVGIGIALVIPPFYSLAIFMGSAIKAAWRRFQRDSHDRMGTAVASGAIAGEGIAGVLVALWFVFLAN